MKEFLLNIIFIIGIPIINKITPKGYSIRLNALLTFSVHFRICRTLFVTFARGHRNPYYGYSYDR